VIVKMGFAGYFLIVWDFINYAKEHGIPVGPGRGSGAGSLVAYSMRITDLDPLPYNLLFERFLNPERVSMPDFDVDFCMNRRDEVIKYVTEKYGKTNVGQIVTMHQLKARGVIRDIARVMDIPYAEADKVAKLVPEPVQGKSPPIKEAIAQEPKLKELYESSENYKFLLDTAQALEGLNRHAGMHAAGVVISEKPLWEYVPCSRGPDGEIVTQFAKDEVEQAGLVKFDFLGLKTLTVIDIAVRLVNQTEGQGPNGNGGPPAHVPRTGWVERDGKWVFDINAIALDDPGVYQMISDGDTTGVFQLESSGFKELLKKLKPDCFEDIIAAGALYRPGPLEGGMVDDFIKRKHGEKRITYQHPALEPILKETYGVIVYQEQVMQIARALAGYSLGGADLLRRAMGKKKAEVMQKEKAKFMAGAEKNNVDPKIADEVFELMAAFAGYGFNKSHSAAYGLVTYQTGFLKRYYPEEFMCGLLTCDKDDTDKVVKNVAEVRAMGIEVLRPDVNQSECDFSVIRVSEAPAKPGRAGRGEGKKAASSKKVIRFGLSAVKGVGEGAVQAIIEAREAREVRDAREGGPFTSLDDFCRRVDARRCNKKVIESLIKSGAFDDIGPNRASLFAYIDTAVERAAQAQRDRESGQRSIFDLLGGFGAPRPAPAASAAPAPPEGPPVLSEWLPKEKLAFEKEALGFYSSGHPIDRYRSDLLRFRAVAIDQLETRPERAEVSVGGMVSDYRERPLKSGTGRMAFFNLEDTSGQIEVVCFSKPFAEYEEVLKCEEPLLVSGTLVTEGEGEAVVRRIHLKEARRLAHLRNERTKQMVLAMNADTLTQPQLEELKALLGRHHGAVTTVLRLVLEGRSRTDAVLPARFAVSPSDELLAGLERLLGSQAIQLQ
jgi:DNA polymerase-3 subunit alpha